MTVVDDDRHVVPGAVLVRSGGGWGTQGGGQGLRVEVGVGDVIGGGENVGVASDV